MTCDRCSKQRVVSIQVELGDGSTIEFSTCQFCESKVWRASEGPVPLSRVLELTSVNRPR